jgi:predicted O-linked N-acetylglucosamine transferase (SPINDLY family)
MNPIDLQRLLDLAISHHDQGRLAEAESFYRQVLAAQPNNADALHRLGALAYQVGRSDAALELISRAIAINPHDPDMQNNAALALIALDRLDEAILACCTALALAPNHAAALNNLGLARYRKGKFAEAVSAYEQAIGIAPDFAQVHNNLGTVQQDMGESDLAIASFRRAIALQPQARDFHYNLGNTLYKKGEIEAAIASYRHAISLSRDDVASMLNLANALLEADRMEQAVAIFQQVLSLRPKTAEPYNGLGIAARRAGDLDAAIAYSRQSLSLQPSYIAAANNLGNALLEIGRPADAIAVYDAALATSPREPHIHGNRIYCMQFDPAYDTAAICAELARWNQLFALPLGKNIRPHANDRNPNRKLRIGYVSPDFKQHVVGWNLLPLLTHHNRRQFEIYCYSSVLRPDAMTQKLRAAAKVWRNIVGLDNQKAAKLIRDDRIDILLDLSVHSALNHLLLFALKPAPLAITYLGYCGSTGLNAIDYRFSDPYLDPPESGEPYAEKTLRLPHTYWCYQPGGNAPPPGPLPAISNGFITLGCQNNFSKVSDIAVQSWAKILAALPSSRLILHAPTGAHRQRVLKQMDAQGVLSQRIEFVARLSFDQYIQTYQRIDIALDPFPYGGGISTCDALWMGVPVISLECKTTVGRSGKSILNNLGLPELLATTTDQYQQMAVRLANDLNQLKTLRSTLRDRMKSSRLMNAPAFAADVEQAFRNIWQQWCRG